MSKIVERITLTATQIQKIRNDLKEKGYSIKTFNKENHNEHKQ